jgi:hypothetical protein
LEGEHFGKIAMLPRKVLKLMIDREAN